MKPTLKVIAALAVLILPNACGKHGSGTSSTDDPYTPVEGEDVAKFLASANTVAPVDQSALAKALALAASDAAQTGANLVDDGGSVDQTDTATINLLKAGASEKETVDLKSFVNPDASTFASPKLDKSSGANLALAAFDPNSAPSVDDPANYNPKNDTVKLDADLMISRVTQIPVKDQGVRGTCAAHTGISYIEYLLLKKYTSKLSTIDLSEQRFYMMSKKDLWSTGGVVGKDSGSAWDNGYRMSMGADGQTVPSDDAKYNIPLESDCPYNAALGTNELQLPQPATCTKGAVKVTSLSETYWYQTGTQSKQWHSNAVHTAQDIVDYLKTKDLPVPVAANITENWASNDGMITLAKDKSPKTLGGHAFLVVGARRLDETKFPNEGGMCFIIKNSWGLGWGTNGYSCMTLAWFNTFHENDFFDVAFDVNLNEDYVLAKSNNAVPDALKNDTKAPATTPSTEPTPTPVVVDPPANPGPNQTAQADQNPPTPAPTPGTTSDGFTMTGLVSSSGAVTKALYKIDGDQMTLKGILRGETDVTGPLTLAYDAGSGHLTYTDPGRGDKIAGDFKDGKITLCAAQYADVCVLHYVAADKRLVLGLTEAEFYKEEADPNADYTSLVSFNGYGIESALVDTSHLDVRLKIAGQPTNPIRLKVDALSGVVKYKNIEIGNYQKLALCSGDFKDVCRFVVNSDDKSLNVFFNAK